MDKNGLNIPDFGPLNIDNYKTFLQKSKTRFFKKWKEEFEPRKVRSPKGTRNSIKEYKKLKVLGVGSFGTVYLVRNECRNTLHAMKAISKNETLKYKQLDHTKAEKLVLLCINCPFAIHLQQFFKDNSYLYFITPFIQGGPLYTHLKQRGRFDELCAMFCIAQVILAIEYLHYMDIVYRDLKPENILVDHTGYLKLVDFGFCKHLTKDRTYSLCGTPEFLAPEMILSKGYGKAADWWGIGILLYELTAGFTPFREGKVMKVYENIIKGVYKMPTYFSNSLKNLIRNILQADTSRRYGNLKNGTDDFKNHKWFRTMDWQALVNRKLKPPFLPDCKDKEDTKYFQSHDYESLCIAEEEEYPKEFEDF